MRRKNPTARIIWLQTTFLRVFAGEIGEARKKFGLKNAL
jgi:hypothetical protein